MKRKHLLLILFLQVVLFSSYAQDDSPEIKQKKRPFIATVTTTDNDHLRGLLYKMNDDSIIVILSKIKFSRLISEDISVTDLKTEAVPVEKIRSVIIKRKNSALRGALFGLGTGATIGVVAGFISGDDPVAQYNGDFINDFGAAIQNGFASTAEEKAAAGGIALGVVGAGTGAIIGSLSKKKFIINGNKEMMHNACLQLAGKIPLN